MASLLSDDELHLLLPDYLNNALDADVRRQMDAYLARTAQARTDLANLAMLLEEMPILEPHAAPPDTAGVEQFLAYAAAHPHRHPHSQHECSWWQKYLALSSNWLKPALAFALIVITGQGALIGYLASNRDLEAGDTRSLTRDEATGRQRGPVLNVQVAPDAPITEVLAAIHDVNGTIIFGNADSPILYIELSTLPPKDAIQKLRQSKVVLSVIEIPTGSEPR